AGSPFTTDSPKNGNSNSRNGLVGSDTYEHDPGASPEVGRSSGRMHLLGSSRRSCRSIAGRGMLADRMNEPLILLPGITSLPIEVFVSALLFAGRKTISHTFALLRR
ncbi:unnamed protein product, partial [Protopolystoma xenopodis]